MNGDYAQVTGKDIPVDRRFVLVNMSTTVVHRVDSIRYGAVFTACKRVFLHPHRFVHKDHPGVGNAWSVCLKCQSRVDAS